MQSILLQEEGGDTRVRLYCMTQPPCQYPDWQTTLILRMVPLDEEGEKEAKRQRSEPTTPISTSSRLPYEYDEVMGITQVDPREAEGFEEGLDLEYHDASENPSVPEPSDSMHKSVFSHGGCGSSSLRECIELLNNIERNAPATLHFEGQEGENTRPAAGYEPKCGRKADYCTGRQLLVLCHPIHHCSKDEPQSRTDQVKSEAPTPKLESRR